MVDRVERRPEIAESLADAVYPSFVMLAGLQLDVFSPLADGPLDADQIGQAIGVRPELLRPLLMHSQQLASYTSKRSGSPIARRQASF